MAYHNAILMLMLLQVSRLIEKDLHLDLSFDFLYLQIC